MFAAVMAKVKTPSISIKNLPRYRTSWDNISIRATEASHRLTWPKQPPTLGVDAGCERPEAQPNPNPRFTQEGNPDLT